MDSSVGVLYVIDELLQLGGAEQNLLRILKHLPRDRFRPYLLTFRLNRDLPVFQSLPCPVEVYPVYNVYGWQAIKYAPRLVRWIRREHIRIVHTFFETSDLWAGGLARVATSAALVSSRRDLGIQRNVQLDLIYRTFGRFLFQQVQAVSDQVRDFVIQSDRMNPSMVFTLPNGIDLQSVPTRDGSAAARAKWGLPSGRPVIATVANIRPVKGIDVLVRTAAEVSGRHPDVIFAVAGRVLDEPYYAEIQALARQFASGDRLRFLGPIDAPLEFLKTADIFFLPSRSEGMSNALLEAMASWLPPVATAVGGNCQLIREGETGFLVPADDPAAAAARLLDLLEDGLKARSVGLAARRVVEEQYSVESVLRQLSDHYEALLDH